MTGCTKEEAERVISQLDGYDEALAKATAWGEENVVPVFEAEGPTPIGELPIAGEATHDGYIGGFENGGDDTPINYLANLTLTYDFGTDTVTGRAFDYVTDVENFETPAGDIELTGGIVDAGGDAGLFF
ncbi:MAG: hypothetical protein QNJ35_14265, partial [Paracoccaceae bacterium]|nr:hypothetical protein [Paracoccaceae bacterium]